MKTKEIPIIEVTKQLKKILDELDIVSDAHYFFKNINENELDEEISKILSEYDEFKYMSQVVMYLVSTKNYVVKADPTYYVLYGSINERYYVWKDNLLLETNVYITQYKDKQRAQDHADDLNLFVEGK